MQDPAAEVCERAQPEDEARALLAEGMTARAYIDALVVKGMHADALKAMAHALPKRSAVWWACLCAAEAPGATTEDAAAAALETARAWVIDPTDARRRASLPAAEAAGMGTPAGCAAAAVYFSGGSLAPPDHPVVDPPDDLTGLMVANALVLAAVIKEPEKAAEKRSAFLRTGLEVAEGRRPWPWSDSEPPAITPREREPANASRRPTHG
jgi:hypothetical protein